MEEAKAFLSLEDWAIAEKETEVTAAICSIDEKWEKGEKKKSAGKEKFSKSYRKGR